MLLTTRWKTDGATRAADLPENTAHRIASQAAESCTVELLGGPEERAAAEKHAAALGTHVPQSVRSEQFWLALLAIDEGLFDQAEALIESNKAYRVAARQAPTVSRDSQTMRAVQQALGVSDAFVDQLFMAAVQVET